MHGFELAGGRVIGKLVIWRRGPLWADFSGLPGEVQIRLRRRVQRRVRPVRNGLPEDVYVDLRAVAVRLFEASVNQFTEENEVCEGQSCR